MFFRILSLTLCFATFAAAAQDGGPSAEAVLEKLSRHFTSQPAFSLVQHITLDITGPMTAHDEVATSIDMKRPNLLRTTQALKTFNVRTVNNDEGLYLLLPERRQYKVEAPEPSIHAALDAIKGSPMGSDVRFLMYLLEDDPAAAITSRMSSIEYVGAEVIDGVQCHHLKLVEEELTWDVWVQDGATPLLKRVVPDLSKYIEERRDQVGAGTEATMRIDFTWNDPAFPADHFAFDAPRDALRVREFQAVNPDSAQFQLLGREAPAVNALSLEGERKSLGTPKGEVWILDFWAIWCQPCHLLMPVVHKVAEAYADQGVRLYSVNVGDDAESVAAFLREKAYDTDHALLDPNHKLASAYELESFPLVVLIGKDGTIQTIRAGYGPGYEQQLRSDLDVLVSGEALVSRGNG